MADCSQTATYTTSSSAAISVTTTAKDSNNSTAGISYIYSGLASESGTGKCGGQLSGTNGTVTGTLSGSPCTRIVTITASKDGYTDCIGKHTIKLVTTCECSAIAPNITVQAGSSGTGTITGSNCSSYAKGTGANWITLSGTTVTAAPPSGTTAGSYSYTITGTCATGCTDNCDATGTVTVTSVPNPCATLQQLTISESAVQSAAAPIATFMSAPIDPCAGLLPLEIPKPSDQTGASGSVQLTAANNYGRVSWGTFKKPISIDPVPLGSDWTLEINGGHDTAEVIWSGIPTGEYTIRISAYDGDRPSSCAGFSASASFRLSVE